ncbi:hypothetical protein R1flu_000517 [Riccia fluitans]|uniref:SHSP domain-containing protein n=1 Tax=Riccia fluitans TaxID=41844 RepID=A0ABD1Y3U0_9MARC
MGSEDSGQGLANFTLENAVEKQVESVAHMSDQLNNHPTQECALDHLDLSDGDARVFLKKMGWDMTVNWRTQPKSQALPSRCWKERITVGLLKDINRQTSTRPQKKQRKNREEVLPGNKRCRLTIGENSEGQSREAFLGSNRVVPARAFRTALPEPPTSSLFLSDLNHHDNLLAHPDKRNDVAEKTFHEPKVVLSKDEARNFLRAVGWQVTVTMAMRKSGSRGDWSYKAPADGNCKRKTFPSLFGAVEEYNRRVRSHNNMSTEQKPTVHLKRGFGCSETGDKRLTMDLNKRLGCLEGGEMQTVRTRITGKKGINPPKRSLLPLPSNRQEQTCGSRPAEVGLALEDIIGVSDEETLSGNQSQQLTDETKTNDYAPIAVIKTFGSFARDVAEDDREYVFDLHILNFTEEQLRIYVENGTVIMKATYSSESVSNKAFITSSGYLTSRLSLPGGAIPELVTATKMKPGILRLTVPKRTEPEA